MRTVAVIGAGISGLAAAYHIKKLARERGAEISLIVFERGATAGGKIVTDKVNGFVIDAGPDSVVAERQKFEEFCGELGIGRDLIEPKAGSEGVSVLLDGKLERLPDGMRLMLPAKLAPLLSTGMISPLGKARAAMEVLVPKKSGDSDEDAASFVCRRFGREVYDRMAEPLLAGIHAGDPGHTSLRCAFPVLEEIERKHRSLILASRAKETAAHKKDVRFESFANGMAELTSALSAAVGLENIRLGKNVRRIARAETSMPKYLVEIDGDAPVLADAVVFATQAYEAGKIIEAFDKGVAALLGGIKYVPLITVSLAYRSAGVSDKMTGSGFLVPHREGRLLSAVTWSSSKWNRRAPEGYDLVRCYFNGAYSNDAFALDDDALISAAQVELKEAALITGKPLFGVVHRWDMGMPQYTVGHRERLDDLRRRLEGYSGIFMTGAWSNGVGIASCISNSEAVAQKVISYISGI
jgi:oxygen-dependent protoporphyrinogen oxidase